MKCFWCQKSFTPETERIKKCKPCRRRQRRHLHQFLRRRAEYWVAKFPTKYLYIEHCGPFTKYYTREHARKTANSHFESIRKKRGVYKFLNHDCVKLGC